MSSGGDLRGYQWADEKVIRYCLRYGLISEEVRSKMYPLDIAPSWVIRVHKALGMEANLLGPSLREIQSWDDLEVLRAVVGASLTIAKPADLSVFIREIIANRLGITRKSKRIMEGWKSDRRGQAHQVPPNRSDRRAS